MSKKSIILLIFHRPKPLYLAYFSMTCVFFLFNKLFLLGYLRNLNQVTKVTKWR
jgi:hypothetical protein